MKLKYWMKQRKKTVMDIAETLGVAPSTVCNWQTGLYLPRVHLLKELCRILDVTADELLDLPDRRLKCLSKPLALDLYKAVTRNYSLDSQYFHQWATSIKTKRGGKLSSEEVWLRNIAEALYGIEIVKPKRKKPPPDPFFVCQLRLF